MKVYILFQGSDRPHAYGNILGVFLNENDAEIIRNDHQFIEEHEVILNSEP